MTNRQFGDKNDFTWIQGHFQENPDTSNKEHITIVITLLRLRPLRTP